MLCAHLDHLKHALQPSEACNGTIWHALNPLAWQKEVEKVLETVREELKYAKMSPWQKAVADIGLRFQVPCMGGQ